MVFIPTFFFLRNQRVSFIFFVQRLEVRKIAFEKKKPYFGMILETNSVNFGSKKELETWIFYLHWLTTSSWITYTLCFFIILKILEIGDN